MLTFAGAVAILLVIVWAGVKSAVAFDDYKHDKATQEFTRATDEAIANGDGSEQWGPLDELQLQRARRNLK